MISMEPVAYIFSKGAITKLDTWKHGGHWKALYTAEQMAEARRQERKRCANVCESRITPGTGSVAILLGAAMEIRALEDENLHLTKDVGSQ